MGEQPISRRKLLVGLAGVAASGLLGGCPQDDRAAEPSPLVPEDVEPLLRDATHFLWSRQGSDGLFGSEHYGILRRGQSLTPFVLSSLLRVPARFDPPGLQRPERVELALSNLAALRNADGAIGFADAVVDYPCYATGLFLHCLGHAQPPGWEETARPSIDWLVGQHFTAAKGWAEHAALGGWGMGTLRPARPPRAGHVDLSMTRRVVEGLRASGLSSEAALFRPTLGFVARCRADNGAFVYSPVDPALNKGERASPSAPSQGYGSATCDALLTLDAIGARGSAEFDRGLEWLRRAHRVDENPGVGAGPMAPFAVAMRGYSRAGAARCFARFGGPRDWRAPLIAAITSEQHGDGAWRNESPLQKEDDPLVATPFAVQALCDAIGFA